MELCVKNEHTALNREPESGGTVVRQGLPGGVVARGEVGPSWFGGEMLFNQTWLMETSCQWGVPIPAQHTHAARCPGSKEPFSGYLHSDGHTTHRLAGIGSFSICVPHRT